MRVLAAVDFGDASAAATALAGALTAASGGRLTVLHAEMIEAPPYFTAAQVEAIEGARLQARAAAAGYVRTFAAAHTPVPVEPRIVEGTPVNAILDASTDFDLLVLGTHGRHGPRRWWVGSVAEGVLRAARVPVLVTCALPAASLARLTQRLASAAPDPRVGWTDVLGGALEVPVHCGDPAGVIERLRSCATPVLYVPDLIPS
jgi:nucleotide-binding universal stress UspA family protein